MMPKVQLVDTIDSIGHNQLLWRHYLQIVVDFLEDLKDFEDLL